MTQHLEFQPKDGGETWIADIGEANGSGFDIVLMLDKKIGTDDSGWILELNVEADGSISGQITAHPGFDALALFGCTQHKLTISDNWGGPPIVIGDQEARRTEVRQNHPLNTNCL